MYADESVSQASLVSAFWRFTETNDLDAAEADLSAFVTPSPMPHYM